MRTRLPNDNLIARLKAKPVTSSRLFLNGVPDPDGLLSPTIHGTTTKEKRQVRAYINLNCEVLDPLVYLLIFKRRYRNIDKILTGEMKVSIGKDGDFIPDEENGGTGFDFVIDNYEKTKLYTKVVEETDNISSQTIKEFLKKHSAVTINKIFVYPLAFRDVATGADGKTTYDPINEMYQQLITLGNLMKEQSNTLDKNAVKFQIQAKLVQIHQFFAVSQLGGKYGELRKGTMGKSVTHSSRTIISATAFENDDFSVPNNIDLDTCGKPLSSTVNTNINFIWHYMPKIMEYLYDEGMVVDDDEPVTREEFLSSIDYDFVEHLIGVYSDSWAERLNKIEIPNHKGKYINMKLIIDGVEVIKPMTVLDAMFIPAYLSSEYEGRSTLLRRYPIQDKMNVFTNKIHLLSTNKTMKAEFMGVEYPYYPDVRDLEAILFDEALEGTETYWDTVYKLPMEFKETLKISNLHLSGLDGDFDGDKVGETPIMSDDANEEAIKKNNELSYMFNLSGDSVKFMKKEPLQALFSMSSIKRKEPEDNNEVPREIVLDFIQKKHNIHKNDILKLVGKFKGKSRQYSFKSKVILRKGDYKGIDKTTETTFGRLVINTVIFSHCDAEFQDVQFDSKTLSKVFGRLADKVIKAELPIQQFKDSLNYYERFAFSMAPYVAPSIDVRVIAMGDEVLDLKKKLIEDNKEALENNDYVVADKICKELIAKAKEVHGDSDHLEHYESGASKMSWTNDFQLGGIMMGSLPTGSGSSTGFKVSTASLLDGMPVDEIMDYSNYATIAAYFKYKNPEIGGTYLKLLLVYLSTLTLGKKDSDCGTVQTLTKVITQSEAKEHIGSYIVEKGKIVRLSWDNIDNYIDQPVELRSPVYCKDAHLCNTCVGDLIFNIVGEGGPVGVEMTKKATELTQKSLQKTHDMSLKLVHIEDLNKYLVRRKK